MSFYSNLKIKGDADIGEIYEFLQKNYPLAVTVLTTVYKVGVACGMHPQGSNVSFLRLHILMFREDVIY